MDCPRCGTANPEVARFCLRCGNNLRSGDAGRRDAYAVNPNEPVTSFSLVTTIMPHGAGTRPSTYRMALAVALAFPVVAAAVGALSFAIVTAAFAIPVVYVIYIYDVNLWEDQPVPVTVLSFVFTAVLSLGFTLIWREGVFKDILDVPLNRAAGTVRIQEILILCLLVPVVAEILKEIGPVILASRPQFDDLMDGLTFGVISGVAYAAIETIVLNRVLIVDAPLRYEGANAALWVSVVITAGLIKPVVYGTASGIACAEFSGLGEGYDGFTPRYFRGFLEAVAANVVFQLGVYLFGLIDGSSGALLGMVWGLAIAAALIVRVRTVLHHGLLEAAVEAAARETVSKHETRDIGYCENCEMPLLDHSLFCISCGNSVRALSKAVRSSNEHITGAAPPTGPEEPVTTSAGDDGGER